MTDERGFLAAVSSAISEFDPHDTYIAKDVSPYMDKRPIDGKDMILQWIITGPPLIAFYYRQAGVKAILQVNRHVFWWKVTLPESVAVGIRCSGQWTIDANCNEPDCLQKQPLS